MSQNFKVTSENIEQDGFAKRFRLAMEQGGGHSALSRATGVSPASITNYLKGSKPKIDVAIKIAEACKVSAPWLIFGDGYEQDSMMGLTALKEGQDIIEIPFFSVEASAGPGLIPAEWENAEMLPFSRDLVRQLLGMIPKNVFMMRVQGDSMVPTIHPRDILLVDYAPATLTQGIYVMCAGGLTLVKRLAAKDPWTFSVISDNDLYPSFDIPMEKTCWGHADTEADLRIIGRVIKTLHDFD